MNNLRLSRIFTFTASHALQASDGHCKPIHGHTYTLRVTLLGEPQQIGHDHHRGMVHNFKDLNSLVNTCVIKPWEGALLLHEEAPAGLIESWKKIDKKLMLLPFQPTCENLLLDIRDNLLKHLPGSLLLHSLRLAESEISFAEWHASDNLYLHLQEPSEELDDTTLVQDCLRKANASNW